MLQRLLWRADGLLNRGKETKDLSSFRAAETAKYEGDDTVREPEASENMVLVAVNRHGHVGRDRLAEILPVPDADLDRILLRLASDERIVVEQSESGPLYRCDRIYISFGDRAGSEAAVFDHFQAMVTAVCTKLRSGVRQAELEEAIGGSTYHFDVGEGHPLHEEVLGFLKMTRARAISLRERVEAYNEDHEPPKTEPANAVPESAGSRYAGSRERVIAYVGQTVLPDERGPDD